MTHSNLHERFKGVLGRLVSALCEELGIPMIIGGNCTIRSADLDRGFEPDDWVYLGSTATRMTEVTATRTLDFRTDPPPDLAIEIEMIRSLLDRIPLYAGVKIPELWRFDGEKFTIWLLQENGEYTQAEQSLAFTMVTPAIVSQYLTDLAATDDAALLRRFRSWIRTLPAAANTTTT